MRSQVRHLSFKRIRYDKNKNISQYILEDRNAIYLLSSQIALALIFLQSVLMYIYYKGERLWVIEAMNIGL